MTLRILIYINLPVFRFRSFIDYALTVSALQGSQAETLDRSENVVSRFGPAKRPGFRIDASDVVLDSRFEFLGAAMHATPKLFDRPPGSGPARMLVHRQCRLQ